MDQAKEAAGRKAAEFVTSGMKVGLGTGSTVYFTLVRLAERIRDEGLSIQGVATSRDTEEKSAELGIPTLSLTEAGRLDLTIDGADEIDGNFQMIKGGGGALLREKIVAEASDREVIIVDETKVVDRLGLGFLLPVEVVPFARPSVYRALVELGAAPTLRLAAANSSYVTDNSNEILDCRFADGIADPHAVDRRIKLITGVVETGLFCDLAHVMVIGKPDGSTEVREKPA